MAAEGWQRELTIVDSAGNKVKSYGLLLLKSSPEGVQKSWIVYCY